MIVSLAEVLAATWSIPMRVSAACEEPFRSATLKLFALIPMAPCHRSWTVKLTQRNTLPEDALPFDESLADHAAVTPEKETSTGRALGVGTVADTELVNPASRNSMRVGVRISVER